MASKTPETLDAKYIAEVLGKPLTSALAEVAEKRPWDPVEYLAQWLYKYKANQAHHQQQRNAEKEAAMSEQQKKEEAESRARRKREAEYLKGAEQEKEKAKAEEERKIREQEERQRKAKESIQLAQPPELATVTEDNEDTETAAAAAGVKVSASTVIEKDEEGQTKLHKLVVGGSVEEVKALLASPEAVDLLAERDCQGKNARDLAESEEMKAALDEHVTSLLKEGRTEEISSLIQSGYPVHALNLDSEELRPASAGLLQKIREMPSILEQIVTAVRSGDLRAVKHSIERKSQAVSRVTSDGATPLHLAVLCGNADVIEYLVANFPSTVQCRDYMNRTPLHYAYTLPTEKAEEVTKLLASADQSAVDCKGRKPEELKGSDELKQAAGEGQPPAATEQPPADAEQPPADAEQPPADAAPATE